MCIEHRECMKMKSPIKMGVKKDVRSDWRAPSRSCSEIDRCTVRSQRRHVDAELARSRSRRDREQ